MSDTLLATVLIAVRADGRARRAVEHLLHQTMPREQYEIILVENGSNELDDLKGSAVCYYHVPTPNLSAARNIGLEHARGRYLLTTDADCVPQPDWVERLVAELVTGDSAAVGGAIVKYEPTTWIQRHAMTIVDGQRSVSYLPATDLPYVATANAGFVTEVVRAIGGFDPELLSGGDVDLCYRVGLAGFGIGVAPGAVVAHEDRPTLRSHYRRFQRYAVYQVLLFAKYRFLTGKRYVLDTYPVRRAWSAFRRAPSAVRGLARGDAGPAAVAVLEIVEALGVIVGELRGAVRYRQLYI